MATKHRVRLRLVTVVALVLTTELGALPRVPASSVAAAQPATKVVSYRGYRMEVPRGWPVYRLANDPERCVRFDQHAVYLGEPGNQENCPSRIVGKVEALLVEPLDRDAQRRIGPDAAFAPSDAAAPATELAEVPDHEMQVVVEAAGVLVTATYGSHQVSVERILDRAKLTSEARPTEVTLSAAEPPEPPSAEGSVVAAVGGIKWAGKGFDACTAPSTGSMQTWMTYSPFGAANIYIGGASRACAQPNLTAAWVDTVQRQGWVLIPTYVGLQAPCTSFPSRIDPARAAAQGAEAANDAVARAAALGLSQGAPIYFDMEAYNNGNTGCSNAVMSFLSAWTVRLHERGYVSGVYSSSASGIADLVRNAGHITSPDDIWFANWDGRATIWGDPYFSDSAFSNRQRIHQYQGDHNETWGGVTINIDSNQLDADVAGGTGGQPGVWWVDTFSDAPGLDVPGGSRTGTLFGGRNYVFCRVWGPEVRNGTAFNHWWLLTDLDVGPASQWVSAYWLSRWGNDQAKDNNGTDIADCNEPYGAIGDKWRSLGGTNSPVGPPRAAEADAHNAGRYQQFWSGLILWHPDTGAFAIHGAIHDAFATNGREATLGYPTSDETPHPDSNGVYQTYQNATIHWTPTQGTWITTP